MIRMNLETKQDVLRFCEIRRREMVACFDRLGRYECNGYSFGAYVFATHELRAPADPSHVDDHKPGKKLARVEAQLVRLPRFIAEMLPPEQHTLAFREVLKSYAKATRSIGVVTMTEMWHVETSGKTQQEALEARLRIAPRLEDAPERGERLMMQLEHSSAGRHIWYAEIKRHPSRVETWQVKVFDDAQGRLSNVVDWRS
jgi:hypothetical protein